MSRVNDQLLKVMSILDVQAKLNPKGATMQLKVELFENAPNYEPLLEKLEQEYGVIKIEQRPDERGLSDADHHMFQSEQPQAYASYISYFITLKPEFAAFYQAEYLKHRSTTDTLTDNNRTLVIGMMKAIDDEVSITGSTKASINPKQFSDENCKKALAFLKRLGAVKNYKAIDEMYYDDDYARMLPTGQVETFEVEIVLPTFDEVLAELESDKTTTEQAETKQPEPVKDSKDVVAATPEQERLVLFMAIIGKAFGDNNQEPIRLPLAAFKPLTFKQVNEFIDQYAGSKTFIVKGRPRTASDATPYGLELTEQQKTEFDELKNNLGHLRDMQMLMIYWGKMCEVYDAVSGGYVGFDDGLLNRHYLLLTIKIDKILAKDEFAELREEKPFTYDTFMGNMEDLDMAYEFMRPELWNFYGKLERQWVEKADGLGAFKLEDDEQQLLDNTDKAIAEHRKEKARLNANFEKRVEKAAAQYNPEQKSATANKPTSKEQPTKDNTPATSKPDIQALQPSSYHDKTGKLNVAAGVDVAIAARGKVKHKNGTKYDQCHLMTCLFKTVNTLNNGVTFSTFLSVKYDKNSKKHIRKIRNTVDEINKKVADKTTAKKLILVHNEKIFIDKSYLKK